MCSQLLSLSREELWDLELHPEENTPDLYLGLGPQDLLVASLTAVLLGGWILFLMRQVSLSPNLGSAAGQPREHSALLSKTLSSFDSAPCLPPSGARAPVLSVFMVRCRASRAQLLGPPRAGPSQG